MHQFLIHIRLTFVIFLVICDNNLKWYFELYFSLIVKFLHCPFLHHMKDQPNLVVSALSPVTKQESYIRQETPFELLFVLRWKGVDVEVYQVFSLCTIDSNAPHLNLRVSHLNSADMALKESLYKDHESQLWVFQYTP